MIFRGEKTIRKVRISVSLDVKTTFLPHPMSLLCRKHITIWVCIGTSTVKMSLSTVKSGYERGRWHMGVDDCWSRQGDSCETQVKHVYLSQDDLTVLVM